MSQEEIAIKYNVKVQLVRDLIKDLKGRKTLYINKKRAELKKRQAQAVIEQVVASLIKQDVSIWSSQRIIDKIKLLTDINVSKRQVLNIMKGKFKLSFRRVKRVVKAGNSERNLVLRSLYA